MNITTVALVILGLVLVSAIVLSATALASVVILGAPHWNWVVPVAGVWLLILGGVIAATVRRSGVKRRGQ